MFAWQVLCMSAREFDEHLENEGWMEDEDDGNESLTFGNNVLNSSTINKKIKKSRHQYHSWWHFGLENGEDENICLSWYIWIYL